MMRYFAMALVMALVLVGCTSDWNETEFTCKASDMCGEYRAIDADRANELKADCYALGSGVDDGLTCDSAEYTYVCYFSSADAETCTYSNTLDDAWCEANTGVPSCLL